MELCDLTIHELSSKMDKKEISSTDILKSVQDRVSKVEDKIGSFVEYDFDYAYKKAEVVDKEIVLGTRKSPLSGIPVAIKDNMCLEGFKTTCCSKILDGFMPPYTATAVKKLLENDALIIGRTNMDEFAMGSSTENSSVKATKNPWDTEYVPGGSSGGSASSVSSGEAIASLGSDTGGSIRQPASFCGVTGLKPTYGLVSRFGLVAFASSLDQIGPITKDAFDSAIMLNAISGFDKMDSTSMDVPCKDYSLNIGKDISGLKIGIPSEYFGEGIDEEIKKSIYTAIDLYKSMGAEVSEFSLKYTDYALPAYYIISSAEASSNLARFDGIRYGLSIDGCDNINDLFSETRSKGFGKEVKRRIILGTYALSSGYYDAYYKKAQQVRTLIIDDFKAAFEKFDIILTPTSPTTAFKIHEKVSSPLSMYLSDVCTVPINIAGLPALSIPCGFSSNLPVGLQLIGKHFGEEDILNAAWAFQKNTDFHSRKPQIKGVIE